MMREKEHTRLLDPAKVGWVSLSLGAGLARPKQRPFFLFEQIKTVTGKPNFTGKEPVDAVWGAWRIRPAGANNELHGF